VKFVHQFALDVAAPTAACIEERLPELLNSPEKHEILTLIVYTAILAFVEFQSFAVPQPSVN